MSELLFNTNEVAHLLDVDKSTVKRWTDEGKLNCYRTPGGHRKFNAENLFDFVTQFNYKSTSVEFLPFLKNDDFILRGVVIKNEFSVLQSVCLNAAIKGKKEDVIKLFVESYRAEMSLASILDNILNPAFKKIITLRETQKISAYEVHLAKNTLSASLILLNDHIPTLGKKTETVVCVSLANDRNDIEFTALVSFLEISGFNILNLGIGATAEDIIEIIEKENPSVICFHTNDVEDPIQFKIELENVTSFLRRRNMMIALGGAIMTNGSAEAFTGLQFEKYSTFTQFEKLKFIEEKNDVHGIKNFTNK